MTNPSVRKQKSGDQLTVGDWLAPGEISERASEVLYAITYPGEGGKHIRLVLRDQGATVPFTDVVFGGHLLDLASDEDLADYREAGRRAEMIADLRAFADWLETNSWAPMPNHFDASVHLDERHIGGPSVSESYSTVREVGVRLGVEPEERLDDRTVVRKGFGRIDYQVIAWHSDGRPAVPEPKRGTTCEELSDDEERPDPIGLAYSRADEADDPTPVSPARVPLHTGGMTDEGLVDESEARPVETYFRPGDRVVRRGGMPAGFPETLRVTEVVPVEGTGEATAQRWQFRSEGRPGLWLHCDEYVRASN